MDPWPYSEAGRFHRGVALVIACVGIFLSLSMMTLFHGPDDLVVLGTTLAIMAAGTYPLARHLWSTPDNAPAALPHESGASSDEEPALRRVSALRTRRRVFDDGPTPAERAPAGEGPVRGGARRTWASAWRDATPGTRTASARSAKDTR